MFFTHIATLISDKLKFSLANYYRPKKKSYTSRGYGCGFYSESILVESKALKQANSWLRNSFSNAVIDQKRPLENRICNRVKYMLLVISFTRKLFHDIGR